MSAAPVITATDLARKASIFEIDEALDLLVQSAEEEAEANNGEITEVLREALVEYVEAFGYKVDRIANYIKAQKAEAETAGREVERLEARRKAAENREKRLKSMLVYYMVTRELRQLRGALNTITLQSNSQPSLVVSDAKPTFRNAFQQAKRGHTDAQHMDQEHREETVNHLGRDVHDMLTKPSAQMLRGMLRRIRTNCRITAVLSVSTIIPILTLDRSSLYSASGVR